MTISNFTVTGMTCAHCARSVTEEVSEVPGVTGVDVDVATGNLTITSESPVDHAAVATAVTEAGYALATP